MYRVKKFIRHAKKVTIQGNVKFNESWATDGYSGYEIRKNTKYLTRLEFIKSYFAVCEYLNGPDLVIDIDGVKLQLITSSETYNLVDIDTGEVMVTFAEDIVPTYTTMWVLETYRWNR